MAEERVRFRSVGREGEGGFILLEKQDILWKSCLESEAAGMAFPKIKCGNNWFYFHDAW